jgi:hypothetical protein
MLAADASFVRSALVDLVLGDERVALAAARAVAAQERWPHVIQLAVAWRLIPQVRDALARVGDTASGCIDEASFGLLRGHLLARAAESAAIVRGCAGVQRVLQDAGVTSVAIKGVATIATLYGASSRRMLCDVDLVVDPGQLDAARAALARADFADISPPWDRHNAAITFSRYLHNYERTFVRDGIEVDLHWQLGRRPPPALRARAIVEGSIAARVEGAALRVSGPVHTALLAVHHALRNSFPSESTLKDIADLRIWWERMGDDHGDAFVTETLASGFGSSLCALVRTIVQRAPAHPIARCADAVEARLSRVERREAARLGAFIERNVRSGAPDNVTVEMMAPAMFARSIAGLPHVVVSQVQGDPAVKRRPLVARIGNRLRRAGRIGRELLRFEHVATYRAVARAQRRFH